MQRSLSANALAIGEVLGSGRRYRIPAFQRPFGWSWEDADMMMGDICASQADAAERLDASPPYLLGGVVLVSAVGDDHWMVIDGQQRLITLTIALAILRDMDEDGVERLGRFIIRPQDANRGPQGVVLSPRPLDLEFFYDHIQRPGGTSALSELTRVENSAQAAMLEVALKLRHDFAVMTPPERIWLAEYILRRCYLVEVSAPYQDQAFKVFKAMNGRGRDLRDADFLKAEILGHLPATRQAHFASQWEQLEAELGDGFFAELFEHIRWIYNPGHTARPTSTEINEALNPASDPERFVSEELLPKGRIMRELLDEAIIKGSPHAADAATLLRSLKRLNSRDWLSLSIAFFAQERRRGDEALAFLEALERQAYVMFLQSGDEKLRLARYRKPLQAILAGASTKEVVDLLDITPYDRSNARTVLDGAIYKKERIRQAVLLRIDERLSGVGARYDVDEVTVEHVLPRNPPPQSPWLELFPNTKTRKTIVDRLGNLALLSRQMNSEVGNMDFDSKKQRFFAQDGVAPFAITTQIVAEPKWTPEVVERRQKALFKIACEIWRL